MTLGEAVRHAIGTLEKLGIEEARLEADILVTDAAQCPRSRLYSNPESDLRPSQVQRLLHDLERRRRGVPLQYIRGLQEFYGRDFQVDPAVLIPRPETELLIEVALELLEQNPSPSLMGIDVGTGSGCIAVTLACEQPRLKLAALDISRQALRVADANRRRWEVCPRVWLVAADSLSALTSRPRFDLIVSNPPYISADRLQEVDPAVLKYEPREALVAAEGGLGLYRRLLEQGRTRLRPQGRLIVEFGYDSHPAVVRLAHDLGWRAERLEKDLAGIVRCGQFGLR